MLFKWILPYLLNTRYSTGFTDYLSLFLIWSIIKVLILYYTLLSRYLWISKTVLEAKYWDNKSVKPVEYRVCSSLHNFIFQTTYNTITRFTVHLYKPCSWNTCSKCPLWLVHITHFARPFFDVTISYKIKCPQQSDLTWLHWYKTIQIVIIRCSEATDYKMCDASLFSVQRVCKVLRYWQVQHFLLGGSLYNSNMMKKQSLFLTHLPWQYIYLYIYILHHFF